MPRNVEEDFLEPYHRLTVRAPLNEELKRTVAAGKPLRINQSTVALEAGHSRTLLSQRAPGYERICALLFPDEILGKEKNRGRGASKPKPETSEHKIARLSSDNELLTKERDQFATLLAEAYLAITLLQRDVSDLKAELIRREKNLLDLEILSRMPPTEQYDPV